METYETWPFKKERTVRQVTTQVSYVRFKWRPKKTWVGISVCTEKHLLLLRHSYIFFLSLENAL